MLEVKELSKKFKDAVVVDKLSFNVNKGEIVCLLGENGAGKTTTLRMISTMLKITSGEVKVNDYDASKEPEKVRREIGILFGGDIGLYDRLTGRENIRYFANLFGIKNDEANKRIDELSKDFGMEDYIDKKVGKFSRGMKQKVSISRSIVHNPSVMLFDEPSTGLDVRATRVVHQFIKKCKEENKTILFSSSHIAVANLLRFFISSLSKILFIKTTFFIDSPLETNSFISYSPSFALTLL